jgi:hypothetical protein
MTAITLPPDLEAWAEAEVAAGRAVSVEALVAKALSARRNEQDYVRGKLDEARASLARGDGIDGDVMLAELDQWICDLTLEADRAT